MKIVVEEIQETLSTISLKRKVCECVCACECVPFLVLSDVFDPLRSPPKS